MSDLRKINDKLTKAGADPISFQTKDELLDAVWAGRAVTGDSVTHCLMEIRAALSDDDHSKVKTLPRRGYLFDLPVADTAPGTHSRPPPPCPSAPRRVGQPTPPRWFAAAIPGGHW